MKLSFRAGLDKNTAPASSEIFLRPANEAERERLDLAALVLDRGIEGFRHGAGPLNQVVIGPNPSLDDLLAATFLSELQAGRALATGAKSFARYAALQREGLNPGSVPLDVSLEGIFLAIRNSSSGDLLDPVAAQRFEADWSRMAAVILRAIERGQDPFTVPLFSEGPDFARERTFLANDRVIFLQDVQRGEQWLVALPGGPPQGRALLMREPRSLLFKQWSRREQENSGEEPFVLLLVDWAKGQWVFSTDPVRRLSLKTLAEQLQQAEATRDPAKAKLDPWFDGQRFSHTLVAAPREGTQLADGEVLKIVRRWSRARAVRKPIRLGAPLAAAAMALIALGAYSFWHHAVSDVDPHSRPRDLTRSSLEYLQASPSTAAEPLTRAGKDFALLVASNVYSNGWPTLSNAEADATAVGDVLQSSFGFDVDRSGIELTRDQFATKIAEYRTRQFGPNDQLMIYIGGHGERIDGRGYLVFKDSAKASQHQTSGYYSLAELREDLAIIGTHCPHVFLVIDTCFGGMMDFDPTTEEASRGSETHEMLPRPKNEIFDRKMKNRCVAFLASVGKTTASDGRAGTHSPFASTIINVLTSAHAGDLVTIPNFAVEVDRNPDQEPRYAMMKGSQPGGDFVFLHR